MEQRRRGGHAGALSLLSRLFICPIPALTSIHLYKTRILHVHVSALIRLWRPFICPNPAFTSTHLPYSCFDVHSSSQGPYLWRVYLLSRLCSLLCIQFCQNWFFARGLVVYFMLLFALIGPAVISIHACIWLALPYVHVYDSHWHACIWLAFPFLSPNRHLPTL